MCNKLASRHVRVGLADPSEVQRCDICENAPGMKVSCLFVFCFSVSFSLPDLRFSICCLFWTHSV